MRRRGRRQKTRFWCTCLSASRVGWIRTTMADEDVKPTSAELQDVLLGGVNANGHSSANTTPAIPEPQSTRPNFKTRFILSGHTRGISAVKFSPDGSMLASSGMSTSCYYTWFKCIPMCHPKRSRGQACEDLGHRNRRLYQDFSRSYAGYLRYSLVQRLRVPCVCF